MKKSYNQSIVSAVMLGLLISPVISFAAETKTTTTAKTPNTFCANIDTTATKLGDQFSKQTTDLNTKKVTRFAKIADNRKVHDEDVSAKRLANDTKHDKKTDALLAKANTDAKKAAVTKFNSDIDAAIKDRQAAIDAAIKTYRAGVDTLVSGKFGTIDTNYTTLKTSIDAAIVTAKSSCASGTDPKTVKATMQATIKAAHDKFRAARTDAEIKTQSKALVDARNASIKAAQAQFKTVADKAKADLKTAFAVK